MYNTSETYKSLIYKPSTRHLLKVYINGVEVNKKHILGFSGTYKLFNDEFCFGSVVSNSISLKLHKDEIKEPITQVYIESGIVNEIVPIGYFNVDKLSEEDSYTVSINLVDNMMKFEFNYDGSTLTYPKTLKDILIDICSKAGVELGSTSFLNDNKEISVYDSTVSAREYISYIAEQAGGFAHIGRDGKLYIKSIGEDIANVDIKYFKNYTWGDKFKVSRIAYEDGIQNYFVGDKTNNTVWINSDNMFIVDNEQLQNIYNKYKDFEAYSFECESNIDPALDFGDILIIDGKRVIYQGNIEYAGKFRASISSKIQSKEREETTRNVVSEKKNIRRIQSKINQIDGEIEQLVQETDENSEKIATVKQNVDSIRNEVSAFYDFTKTVKGVNELKLEDALNTNILEWIIYPENTKGAIYPSNKLFPSKSLFPRKAGATVTLVVSRNSRKANKPLIYPSKTLYPSKSLFPRSDPSMKKEFKFYFQNPLREYNNIRDNFVVEFNQDKGKCIVKILRKIEKNNGVYTIYNEAKEEILGELDIALFSGTNYLYIKEFENWKMEATYLYNTELNKYYSTKVETNSKIQQMADELNLEVARKTDTDELIAKINLKPGQIDMTGLVTANENFKILEDGSIEAKNGTFSGNILLDDGSEIIGGRGLLTNLTFIGTPNMNDGISGNYGQIGFRANSLNSSVMATKLTIDAYIPDGFTIESAYIILSHFPLKVYGYNADLKGYGYSRKVKLYKSSSDASMYRDWYLGSMYYDQDTESYSNIEGRPWK
ncbi:MAG: hypothetical protein Q4D02_01745 [Clostridia bacterium]|nr:hypothetical protein [Clostridia bacterium]